MSPFLMPQVNSIIPYLEDHEIIHLEMGFSFKSIRRKIKQLKGFKSRNKGANDLIVFSMYGSLHGFLVRVVLGEKFKIVNTFGGSDILGSTNSGLVWRMRNSLTRFLSFWTAKRVNHVIVKSPNLNLALGSKIGTSISIIPNGVDFGKFQDLNQKVFLREKFQWKSDLFVVLFSLRRGNSKLESVKNFILAEEVVKELREIAPKEVRLEIITNRSHTEMNELFNAADCLLLTSFHEGSPNIVKEAMACNLPVVSVNCGDVEERLSEVENCYVSMEYDAKELSSYCLKVLQSEKQNNGRLILKSQGLDSETDVQKILSIFKSIA
ncbi:glycosyltransferase family 4 protein [Akkermansiaceae bacterium]|nr:glycosyltransferase family 4 protein [Akkermansiaceae bacterium]MDB4684334.1 glycosyltransferase family 4 protein [Akkermansiaceae bacterium]